MSEYIVERVYDQTTGLDNFGRREEIVRCRDCKHFSIGPNTDCCGFTDKYAHPNGFCSWGEKKEGGK